jgi:hypothetical protein
VSDFLHYTDNSWFVRRPSSSKGILFQRNILHVLGEKRNAYRLLVEKPDGKRPLGRPRRRWVDNIGWGGVDWIGQAQDTDKWRALVNAAMNLWVP